MGKKKKKKTVFHGSSGAATGKYLSLLSLDSSRTLSQSSCSDFWLKSKLRLTCFQELRPSLRNFFLRNGSGLLEKMKKNKYTFLHVAVQGFRIECQLITKVYAVFFLFVCHPAVCHPAVFHSCDIYVQQRDGVTSNVVVHEVVHCKATVKHFLPFSVKVRWISS